jgi:ketosteroid isomerase-like protein
LAEEANLALVRRIFEDWRAADYSDVGWADPQIEFFSEGPQGGVHHGIEAMSRAFRAWLDAFEEFGVEPVGFEASGDAVLVEVRFSGRGKTSGMPLDSLRGANVFVIRDGRVVRLELHIDFDRARRQFLSQT